jgi:hypothetical protein
VASTVPPKGDANPYGIAAVPASVGNLTAGDVLDSNLNDARNRQGTATTIMRIVAIRDGLFHYTGAGTGTRVSSGTAGSTPGAWALLGLAIQPGGKGDYHALNTLDIFK